MRVGVIQVEQQTSESLAVRKGKRVVIGITDRAPRRQGSILWLHESSRLASICQCQVHFGFRVSPIITRKKSREWITVKCLRVRGTRVAKSALEVINNTHQIRREHIVEILIDLCR